MWSEVTQQDRSYSLQRTTCDSWSYPRPCATRQSQLQPEVNSWHINKTKYTNQRCVLTGVTGEDVSSETGDAADDDGGEDDDPAAGSSLAARRASGLISGHVLQHLLLSALLSFSSALSGALSPLTLRGPAHLPPSLPPSLPSSLPSSLPPSLPRLHTHNLFVWMSTAPRAVCGFDIM